MKTIWLSVLLAGCVAIGSIAAFAQESEEAVSPSSDPVDITVIQEEASEAMDVLDEERTPSDILPSGMDEALDERLGYGTNPDLTRRSIANLTSSVYVIPGNDYVCFALTADGGASGSCVETDELAAGNAGPSTASLEGEDIAVYGIVPDGTDSITVETGVSDADVVEVEGNAYYVVFPADTPMREVHYTGPSGTVNYPISDPAEAFEEE